MGSARAESATCCRPLYRPSGRSSATGFLPNRKLQPIPLPRSERPSLWANGVYASRIFGHRSKMWITLSTGLLHTVSPSNLN